ncbi:response regulator transcription factor [bacterium]|nr:response regulator transcription factor [bacterium]
MNRLMVVENEKDVSYVIVRLLEKAGFSVDWTYDGRSAIIMTEECRYDLIVLDIKLPKISGLDVCRQLRDSELTARTPILFLTGLADEGDRIAGFQVGCDDYLPKPFLPQELICRVKAILSRTKPTYKPAQRIQVGQLSIDLVEHTVQVGGRSVHLTGMEFRLLHHMLSHKDRVLSRDELIEVIDIKDRILELSNVDVHIHNLRKKLEENPKLPQYLRTVWGVGYICTNPDSNAAQERLEVRG